MFYVCSCVIAFIKLVVKKRENAPLMCCLYCPILLIFYYTRRQKLSTTYICCSNNFQSTTEKLYLAWEIFICCESLHKYLIENLKIHVIF